MMDLYHEIYLMVSCNRRDLPHRLWMVSGLTLGFYLPVPSNIACWKILHYANVFPS